MTFKRLIDKKLPDAAAMLKNIEKYAPLLFLVRMVFSPCYINFSTFS